MAHNSKQLAWLRGSRPRQLIPIVLIILPGIATFLYITAFGVNVVFGDEYWLVPLIAASRSRSLTFQMLFAQHNEHRILFPRLLMLATASMTHFNSKANMYLYWLCLCIICGLFLLVFLRTYGLGYESLLKCVPVSWILFDFRQGENLLWGWQICWGMTVLFSALALWLLQTRSRAPLMLGLALASGIVASFSTFAGLLVWPVGLMELYYLSRIQDCRCHWWATSAIWSLVGAVAFLAYFHDFVRPDYLPSPLTLLQQPQQGLEFFLASYGAPMSLTPAAAVGVGVLLSCAFLYIAAWQMRHRTTRHLANWLAAATFGLASAGVVTLGRSGLGVGQAMASKYSILGLLGLAGLYLWVITQLGWQRVSETIASATVLGVLAVGLAVGYSDGLFEGQRSLVAHEAFINDARNFDTETDQQLTMLYPEGSFVRQQLLYMRAEKLNIFYGP